MKQPRQQGILNHCNGIWRGTWSFGVMGENDGLLLFDWICLVQGGMRLVLLCQLSAGIVFRDMLCQRLSRLFLRGQARRPREPLCCDCCSWGKATDNGTTTLINIYLVKWRQSSKQPWHFDHDHISANRKFKNPIRQSSKNKYRSSSIECVDPFQIVRKIF